MIETLKSTEVLTKEGFKVMVYCNDDPLMAKRLENVGIIKGKRLLLNQEMLGFGVKVFLGIKLATKGVISLDDFERAASAIPEVQSIEHVLGLYDYRLRVVARDIADFERILRRRIMTLPGAGQVEANVLLSEELLPGPI